MEMNYQTIALALGIIGTGLGIINSYWALSANRARFSVRPSPVIRREGKMRMVPRDVTELKECLNHSEVPKEIIVQVTNTGRATSWITGLGFIDKAKKERFYLVTPDLETKGRFPLEPNEQRSIPTDVTPKLCTFLRDRGDTAFVEIGGGKIFVGSTDAWKSYVQWLKKPNKPMEPTR